MEDDRCLQRIWLAIGVDLALVGQVDEGLGGHQCAIQAGDVGGDCLGRLPNDERFIAHAPRVDVTCSDGDNDGFPCNGRARHAIEHISSAPRQNLEAFDIAPVDVGHGIAASRAWLQLVFNDDAAAACLFRRLNHDCAHPCNRVFLYFVCVHIGTLEHRLQALCRDRRRVGDGHLRFASQFPAQPDPPDWADDDRSQPAGQQNERLRSGSRGEEQRD